MLSQSDLRMPGETFVGYHVELEWTSLMAPVMELFNKPYRPKQKAVVLMSNPQNYAAHAWHHSIPV